MFASFEQERFNNRILAKDNEESEKVNYAFLEYDRFVQFPNDFSSISYRASVLEIHLRSILTSQD